MKAILATLGTSGDFEPILALAVAMKKRGHEPILADSPDFADRAARHGIRFLSLGPPVEELGLMRCLQELPALDGPIEQSRAMLVCVAPHVPGMVEELEDACAAADVLVSLPFQLAGFMAHQRCGIPYVAWSFSPFAALPGAPLGQATRDIVNPARLALGLDALDDPLADAVFRSHLALFATSRHVFRRPRRWPNHYHLTGDFHVDEPWHPDDKLARFFDSGRSPVVVTFGSMRHSDPRAISALIADALERVGCRAVVQGGWSGLAGSAASPAVHWTREFIPHGWLFPRASCIVHHGGAGTTAAALRAGVPSVIVPHALDQPLWAELMRGCGAAAAVIPLRELTAGLLASAIEAVLSEYPGERLARLADCVRMENGTATAVTLIEHLIGGHA